MGQDGYFKINKSWRHINIMKKIKVLHIIPNFGIGGAEKLVLDYLMYFDKNKVDIRALSMYDSGNTYYDKIINKNGLEVYYIGKKKGLDCSIINKIYKIINEFQPDVVHSHLYCIKYLLYSTIRMKNINFFHTIHNEPQKDAIGVDKLANKIAFNFLKVRPVALTDELAKKTNEYYNIKNSLVINNGIYLEKFKNVKIDQSVAKSRLGLSEGSFVIGNIGRFSKQKNHVFILDVFCDILKKREDSFLLLVGDGELREEIENKADKMGIRSNVKFLGIREDIPDIIKAMDVFLFPSLHEGFPITLIEAQATGVKCVISSVIDKNSILSENTLVMNLEDNVEHWSEVILNPSLKNNDFRNIDDYDISKITEKLLYVYGIIENR